MAAYTHRKDTELEAVVGSEQTVSRTEQFYDQVIATQRQIAGKDYYSIVSGLSKYDFQGTLGGVKTYVKKELNHLSLSDLQELSTTLKAEYQTQKAADALVKSDRREYRSAIATVNYYLTQKKKENKSQKLVKAERQGRLSYQSDDKTILSSDLVNEERLTKAGKEGKLLYHSDESEVLANALITDKEAVNSQTTSLEEELDTILRKLGVRPRSQGTVVELDAIDLVVMRDEAPEYSGLSYHLRESRAFKRESDEVLAADIVPEERDSEKVINDGRTNLRDAVYEEELQKALCPRWDTDSFFQ